MHANGTHRVESAAPRTRGFEARCILCGESGQLSLGLADLATFNCENCGNEFSETEVRAHLAEWRKVLAWLDAAGAIIASDQ